MALTKVSGHVIDQPFDVGIITATNSYVSGIGTFGNIRVLGDIQVDGTTTTLDTVVTEVDRLEVGANNTTVAVAVTQSGNGDAAYFMGGDVGIGTDNPNFSTFGGNTGGIEISDVDSNNALLVQSSSNELYFGNSSLTNFIWGASNTPFAIATNNTERLRIKSDGSVGIGTNNPGYKLDVNGVIRAVDGTAPEIIVSDNFANKRFIFGYTQSPVGHNLGSKILADGLNIGYYTRLGQNGSHIFYTNNSGSDAERVRITSDGKVRVPDNGKFTAGDGDDLSIFHNGTHNFIDSAGSADLYVRGANILLQDHVNSNRNWLIGLANGTLELYHSGSKKLETTSGGVTVTGTLIASANLEAQNNIQILDNKKLLVGDGNDLQIYHNGTNSFIENSTGELLIRAKTSENSINCNPDGSVELFYDNSKKLETTTTGAKVTGALEVTQEYPSIRPTLDLNFAATKTLDRRITFTRDSIGTYIDELGNINYASNNTPRFDHDLETGESLGLLIEEVGTNYSLYSRRFDIIASGSWVPQNGGATPTVTANTHTAPDGTSSGVQMADTIPGATGTAFNGNVVQQQYTVASNVKHTFSLYIKLLTATQASIYIRDGATGSISSSNAQNTQDWQRVVVTSSAALTNGTVHSFYIGNANGTIAVWGSQIEDKGFATSYIPTVSSSVTRAADLAKITGTNFTDFYNSTEGTLVTEHMGGGDANMSPYVALLSDGTNNERIIVMSDFAGYQVVVKEGNVNQAILDAGTPNLNVKNKNATAFKKDDFALSLNGGTVATDTSGNLSVVDQLWIGSRNGGDSYMNNTIQSIKYYNKRLPNAQLQGLTQQ